MHELYAFRKTLPVEKLTFWHPPLECFVHKMSVHLLDFSLKCHRMGFNLIPYPSFGASPLLAT